MRAPAAVPPGLLATHSCSHQAKQEDLQKASLHPWVAYPRHAGDRPQVPGCLIPHFARVCTRAEIWHNRYGNLLTFQADKPKADTSCHRQVLTALHFPFRTGFLQALLECSTRALPP